ncbi:MAG: PD-(D/E)XK nuclease-like domain-containing protein [Pseudomonadota bacterium]
MSDIDARGTYMMPADVYHADPAPEPSLSSTLARVLLNKAPLHAWAAHPRLNPDFESETNDAFDVGRAAHAYLTGVGEAGIHVLSYDNYRTKAAQAERDEARAAGKTVLLVDQNDALQNMIEAVRFQLGQHGIGDVFDKGQCEQSHFVEIDGVWCRSMTDCIHDGFVYDFKTTAESADPGAFVRAICNYGYDVQAAHYLDVLEALGRKPQGFRFVVVEKKYPHALSVVEIDESWLTTARKKTARARALFRMCLDKFGTAPWPGYSAQIAVLDEPPWHASRWFEREEMEADYQQQTGRHIMDAWMQFQAPVAAE